MKKILELLVYKPNRWYDNLEEPFRFLVFTLGIILPISILLGLEMYLAYVIFLVVFISWRLIYFARPKKMYVFDLETSGIYDTPHLTTAYKVKHDKTYDQNVIDNLNKSHREELERIGVAHDSRPEVFDMMEFSKNFEKLMKKS